MGFLVELWLPIVVSAVFVFIVSSVVHMALPIHKSDYRKLPGEEALRAAFRAQKVEAGQYMVPFPSSMKDMASPEMLAKYEEGPVGYLSIRPSGIPKIGSSLGQWFVYSLVIGIFVAYAGSFTLPADASFMLIFRFAGTIATLAYALSYVPDSIWKGLSWKITLKFAFDGLLYGLATAFAFAWLWPKG